ncbi:hypothetical protein EUX98_g7402 [Antrodiella citrinella]|uniref:Uncharacterized protein n=1 Tax=Antrodiella citrinella TaxID=2447956 RepID=A0A4S4MM67_9APHY|nr:hypothetical protein EUX98_g7402 [Antrodiella citrinella]
MEFRYYQYDLFSFGRLSSFADLSTKWHDVDTMLSSKPGSVKVTVIIKEMMDAKVIGMGTKRRLEKEGAEVRRLLPLLDGAKRLQVVKDVIALQDCSGLLYYTTLPTQAVTAGL